MSVHKTICNATSDRQMAAGELARNVDVMIVIGGRNSANTGRLVEVCQAEGAVTHHIETAAELKKEWFHSQMQSWHHRRCIHTGLDHRGGIFYYGRHE